MTLMFYDEAVTPTCAAALSRTRVAVVGGGLAGLMAARTLGRLGARVTVYEARAQVGGRVLSDYSTFAKGRIVEYGAELVGSMQPMTCRLAKEYGISLISRMSTDLYRPLGLEERLILDGALTRSELDALAGDMTTKVLRPMAELAARQIRDPSKPWLQPHLVTFDRRSVADALANDFRVPRNGPLWKAIEFLLVNDNVAPLEKMNYLGLLCLVRGGQLGLHPGDKAPTIGDPLMGYWDELEIYRCADGCQRLALELEAEINRTRNCRVHRAQPVSRINLNPITITSRSSGGSGSSESFDYVILAVPANVWPDITITPVHPKDASA